MECVDFKDQALVDQNEIISSLRDRIENLKEQNEVLMMRYSKSPLVETDIARLVSLSSEGKLNHQTILAFSEKALSTIVKSQIIQRELVAFRKDLRKWASDHKGQKDISDETKEMLIKLGGFVANHFTFSYEDQGLRQI